MPVPVECSALWALQEFVECVGFVCFNIGVCFCSRVYHSGYSLSNCLFKILVNSFSPEISNKLFAGILLDNSIEFKFFRVIGKSEANSGPFLIFIENFSSKLIESH